MKKKKPISVLDSLIEENGELFAETISLRKDLIETEKGAFRDGLAIGWLSLALVGFIFWALMYIN